MGKVKVKVIGDEQLEQEEKEKNSVKREQKEMREGKKTAHVAGMKGGERTTTVGVSEEEIAAQLESTPAEEVTAEEGRTKKAKSAAKKRVASKRHKENESLISKAPSNVARGIEALRKFKASKIDETVELHINTKEKGINGTVVLPHGTGKTLRIKVVDDAVIAEVEKGKIDFDVLVATPSMMPKLAKIAKVLGPRGLMPNPKNGTITTNPEQAVEKLSKGQIGFKTEAQAPLIHVSVGKLSFEDKMLADNISAVLTAVGAAKINSVTLKSTMSPAVRLQVSSR